jgi:hypothetical protein
MFPTVNLYRSALMLILLLASILEVVGGCQRPSNSARRHADSLLVAPSAINASYLAYPDGREQLTYTIDTDYPAIQQFPSFPFNCRIGAGRHFARIS